MKNQLVNPLMVLSEIKVSYHPKFKACERPTVSSANDAYQLLRANWDLDRIELNEQFFILLLNRNNRVIGFSEISSGGFSGTLVDPKMVFSIALKACCSSLILCHNHPSGNVAPSYADISITEQLAKAALLLEMKVVDHLIISRDRYYSFSDEGLI